LSGLDLVAVFLDGKTFADMTMVLAVGIALTGEKHLLGFVETGTENEAVLTPFLQSLSDRGLKVSQGVLVIIDGGKGLRAAVRQAWGGAALVQRCQWHKRENVVRHLPTGEQAHWRTRLQRAYRQPTYEQARTALAQLQRDLEGRNQSAARSLAEGLEETLTLHRLGVFPLLGESFKTTNCIESINAAVAERCDKVDRWVNSSQRHRWLASALLDIEPRLRRVKGYRHLPTLRAALQRDLKIMSAATNKAA
jgi:transposase-like protein